MSNFKSLGELMMKMAEILTPPRTMTVAEAVSMYRYLNTPGGYNGPWLHEKVPYMVRPLNCLADPEVRSVIFTGPAQSAKTELFLNWVTYSVCCDPMDMILYQTAQHTARDFSKRRMDRLHAACPDVSAKLLPGGSNDNVFDKHYHGMMLTFSWPTINELSGRPVPRVALTDYDRMSMNVEGEGSPFDLAKKRTTTFGSNSKVLCESSPGFIVKDPKHYRASQHEAPPCEGILSLHNRGTRELWFWECPYCRNWFEPAFRHMVYPDSKDFIEASEAACIKCPSCQKHVESKWKYELNLNGQWVAEGQFLTKGGKLNGAPRRSDDVSFWLKGPAAGFQKWSTLVINYLKAEEEFHTTGSQESLKTTVNTDQGEPYVLRGLDRDRTVEELKDSAIEAEPQIVPFGTRLLLATIDIQKHRFVVQVFAVIPNADSFNLQVIDRFDIIKSKRLDPDGERLWVTPATFLEDWHLISEQVIDKQYLLQDNSGYMAIHKIGCDIGGRAGVTSRMYEFYVSLRRTGAGRHKRFQPIKGDPLPNAPRARITWPDAQRKDRLAQARGEVPVLMLNVNLLKDRLDGMFEEAAREAGGAIILPDWLPDEVLTEYTVEIRGEKGWENPRGARNEAWDLTVYALGLCTILGLDKIDFSRPPAWAAEWSANSAVTLHPAEAEAKDQTKETRAATRTALTSNRPKPSTTIEDLAKHLG